MRRIISWFSFQKIILFLILGVIVYQSRLDGSQWLLGWDSVVPELDWKLNFRRVFVGAWQEYQGVGLTGGMAHLADLSRMVILWVVNLIVSTQYVRWLWHLGMLVLGTLGIWNLGKKLWRWSENASLTASAFYLLNLATVQYFFVPYEAFSSFYGFLPWLIGVFLSYIETGTKKDLGKIVLVGILATSAFYVQTLFVVYLMVIGVLSLSYWREWKRAIVALLAIFVVNSSWLLPVLYGIYTGGSLVGMAKINSIGSPETALMNESFGRWGSVAGFRGFWLEYIEWAGESNWGRLMQDWWAWGGQRWVEYIGWVMFGISIVGMLWGLVKKKIEWGWVVGLLLTYVMVASFNPPTGIIYGFLVDHVPLFGEMFRSVFTKWSTVLALFVSLGLGSWVAHTKNKWVGRLIACMVIMGSGFVVWPVFKSGIIFDKMKVELPTSYAKLFEFMRTQPKDARVVYLPAQNMWSWKYTDWGYRGSGFLWYGIEQPILDRAFDVWSPYNETFYNQFSTALYGGNASDVERVLKQYDVRYVLLDESVIAPGQGREILRIDETKKIAEDLEWSKKFHEGYLTVWDTNNTQIGERFVSAPPSYSLVSGDTVKTRQDVVFNQVGTYVDENAGISYPFAQLMREELMGVEYGQDRVTIGSDPLADEPAGWALPSGSDPVGRELIIPAWEVGDIVRIEYRNGEPIPACIVNGQPGPIFRGTEKPELGKNHIVARVSEGSEWEEYLEQQTFEIGNNQLEVEVIGDAFVYDFAKDGQGSVGNCDVLKRGEASKNGSTYVTDQRGAACDYVIMQEIDPRLSYLMRVQGENMQGRSLKFFLYNTWSKRNDIEWLLKSSSTPVSQYTSGSHFDSTFSLLPWRSDGFYTLNIETRSFGQRAENRIDPIEVRWFPLKQIAAAKVIRNPKFSNSPIESGLRINAVKKTGTWLYRVKVEGSGLLKLSQGYDEGWIAPPLEHVKVDGWANGWMIKNSGEVTILYWPQLLEYLGFVLLGVTGWAIYKSKNKLV